MRILAVGDIHCKVWVIDKVVKRIDDYDKIVFVGDYVDDFKSGPMESMASWEKMKALCDQYPDKVYALMGNHDYAYTLKVGPRSSGFNLTTKMFLDMPTNRQLKHWVTDRPTQLVFDGVTFSHAGIDTHWKDGTDLWVDYSPIWVRPGDAMYAPIPQVFGHTPHETCTELEDNIWCIDTFSTHYNGDPIGDHTALEIIDGKEFNVVKL